MLQIDTQLPSDIQQLLLTRSRELVLAENPREVLKEQNNKRSKHASRECEDDIGRGVSARPAVGLKAVALQSAATGLALSPEEVKGESGNVNRPARTTISGISVQHVRTRSGIKVCVNLQTQQDAEQGVFVQLTAELKRSDRLRELKPYADDSVEFAAIYADAIQGLKDTHPHLRRKYCLGRLHDRGQRDLWYADMMALGILDHNDCLESLLLNIHGQEFDIKLDQPMSANQAKLYHCNGLYGQLVNHRKAPTLLTAPRKAWK